VKTALKSKVTPQGLQAALGAAERMKRAALIPFIKAALDALPATGGPEAFDRVVDLLEAASAEGDQEVDERALDAALALVGRRARRGSIVVVVSDFLDLPKDAPDRIASLGVGGRTVVALSILDPAEATFPFQGPIRFRSSEGNHFVETDASTARDAYLAALARNRATYRESLLARGGRFVEATTTDDPVSVVLAVLGSVEGVPA